MSAIDTLAISTKITLSSLLIFAADFSDG